MQCQICSSPYFNVSALCLQYHTVAQRKAPKSSAPSYSVASGAVAFLAGAALLEESTANAATTKTRARTRWQRNNGEMSMAGGNNANSTQCQMIANKKQD